MRRVPLSKSEINIKKFKKGKRLNKGRFGVVYKVEDKETGEICAAKVIDCNDDEERCNEIINREVEIMMYANHSTIIKFLGYSRVDFQEEHNVTILMELASNGSLRDVLNKIQKNDGPKDYSNTTRQIILVGIIRGMKYLHDRDIIHRDLKAENILLDEDFHPHITDFGLSKFIDIGHSHSQTKFGGTLSYEAPEILKRKSYGKKIDVYSFAILMFEILTDQVPYPELENNKIAEVDFMNKVINENYRPKFKVPVKKSLRKLIKKCRSNDPEERPSFDDLFNKLANKEREMKEDEESENYVIDDVDMDEFNIYVEDVLDATDSTDKMANKIAEIEKENIRLKKENKKLETENKQQRNEIESIKKEKEQLANKIKKLETEIKQQRKEAESIKKEKEKLDNEIKKLETENKQQIKEKKQLVNKFKKLEAENNQLKGEIESIKKGKMQLSFKEKLRFAQMSGQIQNTPPPKPAPKPPHKKEETPDEESYEYVIDEEEEEESAPPATKPTPSKKNALAERMKMFQQPSPKEKTPPKKEPAPTNSSGGLSFKEKLRLAQMGGQIQITPSSKPAPKPVRKKEETPDEESYEYVIYEEEEEESAPPVTKPAPSKKNALAEQMKMFQQPPPEEKHPPKKEIAPTNSSGGLSFKEKLRLAQMDGQVQNTPPPKPAPKPVRKKEEGL